MSEENLGSESAEDKHVQNADHAVGHAGGEPADEHADDGHETAEQKKARLESALRKYRSTLRNEAETGNEGFSADYYRSQKPPHW